uniref:CAND6/7 N-terminal domain-containing protein n=1 Tax=Nelumbo nucifera TaxID=4432 RepID=A0A822XMV2_NELNU|nr:TPA_asm: hypothetical protein HUJ06_021548 [Nelumbo nucifera]
MSNLNFISTFYPPRHLILHLFSALCIISSIPFSASEIKNTRIIEDSRPMILFERFGFGADGHVAIAIKNVSWKSKQQNSELDPSSMGFFLLRELSYPKILNESEYTDSFCIVSSRYVELIFKFEQLYPDSTYNGSVIVEHPDEYSLVFGNCQPEYEVSMDVHTEMYNVEGGRKDFLPAGQTQLPKLYFLFFLVYTAFFTLWVSVCIKQSPTVDKIHIIMGALLLVKALKLICAAEDKFHAGHS